MWPSFLILHQPETLRPKPISRDLPSRHGWDKRRALEVVSKLQGISLNILICLDSSYRASLAVVGRSAPGQPSSEDEAVTPSGLHLSQSLLEPGSGEHQEADLQVRCATFGTPHNIWRETPRKGWTLDNISIWGFGFTTIWLVPGPSTFSPRLLVGSELIPMSSLLELISF